MTETEQPATPSMTEAETERAAQAPKTQPGLERATGAAGSDQVQAKMDAIQAVGYFGSVPDPTPDSAYTVAGVLAGAPTPENNEGQAAKADAASRDLAARGGTDAPKSKR